MQQVLRADLSGAMFGVNNTSMPLQKLYSPLMLSSDWPKIARLVLVLFCASFGSTMNGFFVAAFFVEHTLKRIGYIYLACAGFADLLITAGVMSISSVVLLSGQWDNLLVCRTAQFTSEFATYAYTLFFMLAASENYYRVCRTSAEYQIFLSMRIGLVSIFVYILSFVLAAVGVLLDLDYDYCERQFYGNISYRFVTAALFYGFPTIVTLACLIASMSRVRRRSQQEAQYRRSRHYRRDHASTVLNITAYVLYVVGWIPYVFVVNGFPAARDDIYYNTAWIGLSRSVFGAFICGITNRYFRRAYAHLFNYCFCKNRLSSSYASRHGKVIEFKSSTGDVKVHIIQQAVSNSSHRGASTSCETQEL